MKILAILLSVFIFYMVSLPCVDEVIHNEISTTQSDSCNHSDHDACSPFCVCSCCGIVVVLSTIISDFQPSFIVETELRFSYKAITSSFSQSFWQPPKLV